MIENERQYGITGAQMRRFEEALAKASRRTPERPGDVPLLVAEREGLRSQLDDLRREITEYENLRSGSSQTLELASLEALPQALIRARVAAGLNQRELGDRLQLKEQQVQRYESTRYASASLRRVLEVARALGVRLRQPATLLVPARETEYLPRPEGATLRVADAAAGASPRSKSRVSEGDGPQRRRL